MILCDEYLAVLLLWMGPTKHVCELAQVSSFTEKNNGHAKDFCPHGRQAPSCSGGAWRPTVKAW